MSNDRTQDQSDYLKTEQEEVQALDMHKIPSLKLWSMLIVVTALSQFHRNALGVMAPDLMRDFRISPSLLGTVGSMFAIATALAQIPVGLLFDKFGVRSTVTGLLAIATIGAVVEVFAYSGEGLAVARFILGVGCAANLMGAVALIAVWYPATKFLPRLSWIYALSQVGAFMATSPLAAAGNILGWRWTSAVTSIATGTTALLFWLWVRDGPSGRGVPDQSTTT